MTVCIAGIALDEGMWKIIMCSDTRISYSGVSSDTAYKFLEAGPNMIAMAADNLIRAKELLAVYRNHFTSSLFATHHTPKGSELLEEAKIPPRTYKRQRIEEYLQLRWSVSFDQYTAGILSHLPQDEQYTIARNITEMDLECQLIICTYDGVPRIFKVDGRGFVSEAIDFAIIGSGEWIAHSALCQRAYSRWTTFERAVYLIYEAKKLSEREPTVGPKTNLMVITHDGKTLYLNGRDGTRELDDLFTRFGPQELAAFTLSPNTFAELEIVITPDAEEGDSSVAATSPGL